MQFDDRLGQVLLICVAVFIATPLAAQPKYTIIDLGTLGGDSSFGYGLNSSGHVTGHSPPKAVSNTHAFYYDGQMHDLGTLGSSGDARFGIFSAGNKINDSNQIVGTTLDAAGSGQAFLWDAQHGMQSLGLSNTYGVAINSKGQIVGETASVSGGQVGQGSNDRSALDSFISEPAWLLLDQWQCIERFEYCRWLLPVPHQFNSSICLG